MRRYLLRTLHMQGHFQLQASHLFLQCIFFPLVLLQRSNFNKIMSFFVYLLVHLGPILSVKNELYATVKMFQPPPTQWFSLSRHHSVTGTDRFPLMFLICLSFNGSNERHISTQDQLTFDFLPVCTHLRNWQETLVHTRAHKPVTMPVHT